MLAFQPAQLGVVSEQVGPERLNPEDLRGVMQKYIPGDAYAALDGPMFNFCPGEPHDYASYQCAAPVFGFVDKRRGVDAVSTRASDGITISIVGGQPRVMQGFQAPTGASVAVQLYPTLVRDGQAVNHNTSDGPDSRAALAILGDGRMALVTAEGLTLEDFATALADYGVRDAGYTDGGGSTGLAYTENGGVHTLGGTRRVAAWLVVEKYNHWSTATKVAVGVGAAVAAGGLLYWLHVASTKRVHSGPVHKWLRAARRAW